MATGEMSAGSPQNSISSALTPRPAAISSRAELSKCRDWALAALSPSGRAQPRLSLAAAASVESLIPPAMAPCAPCAPALWANLGVEGGVALSDSGRGTGPVMRAPRAGEPHLAPCAQMLLIRGAELLLLLLCLLISLFLHQQWRH